MKTMISTLLIFSLFGEVSICQQNELSLNDEGSQFLIGNWKGTIDLGVRKFTFVFRFWINDDKVLQGAMDSPEQDLKDIPVNEILITGDSLKLDIRSVTRKYHGVINRNDNIINGLLQKPEALTTLSRSL